MHSNLAELLGKVSVSAGTGLTLAGACALHGVLRRPLVSWVRLADEEIEPFRGWLAAILERDAAVRARYLVLLAERAEKGNRRGAWAARDLSRQRGAPSELERELGLLRRDGRARQARLDARKLQRELDNAEQVRRSEMQELQRTHGR